MTDWRDAVVVGLAVVDVLFRIDHMPGPDESIQVDDFDIHPGGKGLTQAVALARLDFNVKLVAKVGDDYYGKVVLDYLEKENVDVSLVQVVEHEKTPVTGVITYRTGRSTALGWKNNDGVGLRAREVELPPIADALLAADFVLTTFEPAAAVIERTLSLVKGRTPGRSPVTIMTPAPPYDSSALKFQYLPYVDYLVASQWEVERMVLAQPGHTLGQIAQDLMASDVGCVCFPLDEACHVYWPGDQGGRSYPRWPAATRESAGARDAFCAALAFTIAMNDGKFDPNKIDFATAAMAACQASEGVPNSMPTLQRINKLMKANVKAFPERRVPEQTTPPEPITPIYDAFNAESGGLSLGEH